MRGDYRDRLSVHVCLSSLAPRGGPLLCVLLLLSSAPHLAAQPAPAYGSGAYPPMNPYAPGMPTGPAPYPQPIQRAQNIYYGNYQSNTVPGYIYPRSIPAPSNYSDANNSGITYYYVQNPNGPNSHPLASPYGVPPSNRKHPSRPSNWPIPANTAVPVAGAGRPDPLADDPYLDGRKPTVTYHRPTNEKGWIKAEYLASVIRPMGVTGPLATTGSLDFPQGAIGQPATSVLYGDQSINHRLLSGLRLEGGVFLDDCNRFSLGLCGFFLIPGSSKFSIASDANGTPLIARPTFNTATGQEGSFVTAAPGLFSGTLTIETLSEMAGVELNARHHSYARENVHVTSLLGVRYLRLAERMRFRDQLNPIGQDFLTFLGPTNFVNAPNFLMDEDLFRTVNQFIGPQIGGRVSWENQWLTLDAFAKVALGATAEQTSITGSTTLVTPGGKQTAVGGVLAQNSNIGTHSRTVVGIIPELGLNVGIELTRCLRLQLGYSLLMWNSVLRPGNQIDRNVNPGQSPGSQDFGITNGPLSPVYRFNDEYFWSHTFNVGMEFHF